MSGVGEVADDDKAGDDEDKETEVVTSGGSRPTLVRSRYDLWMLMVSRSAVTEDNVADVVDEEEEDEDTKPSVCLVFNECCCFLVEDDLTVT